MLYLAGAKMSMDIHILDKSHDFPAGKICPNFTEGDFTVFEDVMKFGENKDIITVEIEKINVAALLELEGQGKKVYPQSSVIEIIQDKGLQKQFYNANDIPTSHFEMYRDIGNLNKNLESGRIKFPFIQKKRRDGYDGRGVLLIKNSNDLSTAFPTDFIVEEKIEIQKELAVIVCRDVNGNTSVYDPVEMVFDPENHILLYQIAPADLTEEQFVQTKSLALLTANKIDVVGLLAIEMFLDNSGNIMVNEVAPRPHNSGHHTIEACICSQYENHLRAISSLPLGSSESRVPSLLMNLLGEDGYSGKARYQGLEDVLKMPGVYVHIYGKEETRPHRKMGHITIIDRERNKLEQKYKEVSELIKVIS